MRHILRPEYWFYMLLAYFTAQTGLHVLFGSFLSGSQIEHLTSAVDQPPFYQWLVTGFTVVFGETVLAFAVLNNVLLLLTCVALFHLVRRFGQPEWAWAGVLCLFFVPQLSWVAQHDSGLADLSMAVNAVILWSFSTLLGERSFYRFVLFGISCAVAVVTSAASVFFAATLFLAAASQPRLVSMLFSFRMAVAVAVAIAAAVVLPMSVEQLAQCARNITTLEPSVTWERLDALRLVSQAVIGFAGFLMVGVIFLVQRGLGAMPKVSDHFLTMRQTLLRQVVLGFVLFLAYLMATDVPAISFDMLRPYLITIIPLSGFYLAPLLNRYMQASITRFAAVIALVILAASPVEYGKSSGGLSAWYLEFRASEGARTPLL